MEYLTYGVFASLCAVISAKWAMDLGYSQVRQLMCALGGLLLGPLMPLILYVRFIYKYQAEERPGGQCF